MNHNGADDAIKKIDALEKAKETLLRRIKISEQTEVSIEVCLHNNGFREGSETRKRILFHVSRIFNEYRIQERIRFEKATSDI